MKGEIYLPEKDIIQFAIAVKDGLFEPIVTGLKKYIKFSKSVLNHINK